MEDELRSEVKRDVHYNEDNYFEDLIPLLYKPAKSATMQEALVQELPFVENPEPEPIVEEQQSEETVQDAEPEKPKDEGGKKPETIIDKWRRMLGTLLYEDTE